MEPTPITINTTNERGERSLRRILPTAIRFGVRTPDAEPQWLLIAWDLGEGAERDFALKNIDRWAFADPT